MMNFSAYIRLSRLDRPIGIWLLLLPGWWAIMLAAGGVQRMNAADWKIFILFGVGAVLMRSAGCVINDLWDRKLDRQVARTKLRPLAAGEIGVFGALVFLFLLLLLSFCILLQMNLVTILLGVLSLPFIIAYPLMKRITWWPQAFLGLTFNFGALMGWAAIAGTVQIPALLLYAGGILWTLGYDTIYAHQDREDDALAGIKSSALKLGEKSFVFVRYFYIGALVLIAAACMQQLHSLAGFVAALPAAAYIRGLLAKWNVADAASSLSAFRGNREFGFLFLAGIAVTLLFYSP